MSPRAERMSGSRLPLQLAFATIALVLIATSALTMFRLHTVQGEVRKIVNNQLASIQQVDQMRDDVDVHRRLVESHILADTVPAREAIEEDMARVENDYDEAAKTYAPLAILPGEKDRWRRAQNEMAMIRQRLPEVLALSRDNLDARAVARLNAIDDHYASLDQDTRALAELNAREAAESVLHIYSLQRSALVLAIALGGIGLLLTLAIGLGVSTLLSRRDERIRSYAEELERRNRDLDAFAGRVAHDLRGPLTTISLATDNLIRRRPEEQETHSRLRRGVSRMETLISDLLSLSRIDANARQQQSNPAEVAAQLAEEINPRLTKENAHMHLAVEPSSVLSSDGLLRQALWNLTDNALRYTRPGTPAEIDIRGRRANGQYELTVTDNGIGMSPEEAQRAFEPFFRGESAREKPGTGLGLSIVKRVVEANGGDISVSSARGKGTRFVLRLQTASL